MQPNMEKYHLEAAEINELLDRCKEGVLCTIGQDGYPYGTPVNYIRVGDEILFHGRKAGEKVDNIRACNKVCLTVMVTDGFERCGPQGNNTTTNYESVIVRGTVSEITDEAAKVDMLKAVIAKLVPERIPDGMNEKAAAAAAVYSIKVESATGKYHRPMPGNRTIH